MTVERHETNMQVTGLVVDHIESWDVEPGKVLRGLLKPSAAVPSNPWEVTFAALYSGNPWRVWLAVHRGVLAGTAVLAMGDVVVRVATGSELQLVRGCRGCVGVRTGVRTGCWGGGAGGAVVGVFIDRGREAKLMNVLVTF